MQDTDNAGHTESATPTERLPFHYFKDVSLERIIEEAIEIQGKPNGRMEIHAHGDSRVIRFFADGYEGAPINESHLCPIDCP